MKFMIPAVMALAAAPDSQAWSLMPSSHSWPSSDLMLMDNAAPTTFGGVLKRQRELANRMLEQTDMLMKQQFDGSSFASVTSPRYELVDDDEKFQVSLDVPGVKPEDMTISLEQDGYITIRGERVATTENSRFASKFSQTFSLDPSVDVESFNAKLDSGVLVISAAKDKSKIEDKVRKIPITAMGESTVNKALHASASAETDQPVVDEKATTTTSEKLDDEEEEVMDLDKAFEGETLNDNA